MSEPAVLRYPDRCMRTVIGLLAAAVFLAAIVWVTLQQIQASCEVCMHYRGRQVCETASGIDRDEALLQARNTACAQLSGGVTDGIQCNGTPPQSVRCSE